MATLARVTRRKQAPKDLTGIRQRGSTYRTRLYAELRICRQRCHVRTFVEHRTSQPVTCDARCSPHGCKPLALSSVRQCHAVLSGALSAAKRWGWITVNPLDAAQRPAHADAAAGPAVSLRAAMIVKAVDHPQVDSSHAAVRG